jgi:O-antigen/teichoic acid export membrane protein
MVVRNIVANVAGAGAGMLVFLLMAPVYLRLLGAEGYGLVGVFMTLSVAATALDLGLGSTLNRELARMRARDEPAAFADLIRTLEITCWGVGGVLGAAFTLAAPAVAERWLNIAALTPEEVTRALHLIGLALPALIARTFYLAGLNGLEHQGRANVLLATAGVGRALITLGGLLLLRPSVTVFFVAQLLALYVEAVAWRITFRSSLPAPARPGRLRPAAIRPSLGFTAGVAGTMLLGLGLTSVDQLILSAILPLAEFGYYTLALAAGNALGQFVQPITTAIYPRFSRLVEHRDTRSMAADYQFFSQLVAVLVLPAGAVLAFFPADVLTLWTRSPDVARHAAAVLALRTPGTILNTLMHVPHVMQLAFGWSSLGARVNAVALAFVVPATVVLGRRWGGAGAALVWTALNLTVFLLAMARMHARVLPGELPRWYANILLPACAVVGVAIVARLALPEAQPAGVRLAWLLITGAVAAAGALAAATTVRRRVVAAAVARQA